MKVSTILAANSCNVSKTACGFVTTETERCLNGQTEVCGFTNEITNDAGSVKKAGIGAAADAMSGTVRRSYVRNRRLDEKTKSETKNGTTRQLATKGIRDASAQLGGHETRPGNIYS